MHCCVLLICFTVNADTKKLEVYLKGDDAAKAREACETFSKMDDGLKYMVAAIVAKEKCWGNIFEFVASDEHLRRESVKFKKELDPIIKAKPNYMTARLLTGWGKEAAPYLPALKAIALPSEIEFLRYITQIEQNLRE